MSGTTSTPQACSNGHGECASVALDAGLYERTHILLGDRGMAALRATSVLLAGAGGVGGHCAEALVRAGVGKLTIIDDDVVCASNKNRQVIALDSTLGMRKADALAARLRDINAQCDVVPLSRRLTPDNVDAVLRDHPSDFVVDCIDSVDSKVALLAAAVRLRRRVYASGGAGGRLDATKLRIGDVYDTHNDRLSRACRIALRKRGVAAGAITWVHSIEKGRPPRKTRLTHDSNNNNNDDDNDEAASAKKRKMDEQDDEGDAHASNSNSDSDDDDDDDDDDKYGKYINGTISYMPAIFGLTLASAVLRCAVDTAAHDAAVQLQHKRALKRAKRQLHKQHKRERAAAAAAAAAVRATTVGDDSKRDQQ